MRVIKRLAATLAVLGLLLVFAAPAYAVELTNDVPISSEDSGYPGTAEECDQFNLQPGQVVWHFVLNQSDTDDQTLTATFQNAGTKTVSPSKVVDSYVLHYYIPTGTDTLLSASTSGDTGNLQLSHICSGGPGSEIPEAPAASLLLLSAGLLGLGFVGWRMRKSAASV
jgi:hypothetical protein